MSILLVWKRPLTLLIATLVLTIAGGCETPLGERQLIQPADPSGQACAAGCELPKAQCEQRQRLREEECQQHFARQSEIYDDCATSRQRHCLQPEACLGVEMRICEFQYEECVLDCGGRVESRLDILPPAKETEPASTQTSGTSDTGPRPVGTVG